MTDDRIDAGDDALLPGNLFGLSVNEWHAIVIGCVGVVPGVAFAVGFQYASVAILATLAGYAIVGRPMFHAAKDAPAEDTIALKTIAHEPWYFLSSLLLTFADAAVVVTYAPEVVAP